MSLGGGIINFYKYFFVSFLFYTSAVFMQVSEFKYKQITSEDGLVDDMALRVQQDANGYMWFGTRSGLVRYDGVQLKTYTSDPNQPDGLNGNNIDALHLDGKGNLWIGTINGLSRYDPIQDRPVRIPIKDENHILSPRISDITSDQNGLIWISSYDTGLFSYDPGKGNSVHYDHISADQNSLPSSVVFSVLCTGDNNIWIGTQNGLSKLDQKTGDFIRFGMKNSEPFNLSDSTILSLEEGENGDIWIGTRSGGLNRLNLKDKSLEVYKHNSNDSNSLSSNRVVSILYDKNMLWLGCGRGTGALQRLDVKTGIITKFRISEKKLGPRIIGSLNDLFKDKSGIIWVCQSYGGVSYFDPVWESYQHYQLNPQDPSDLVNAVYGTLAVSKTRLWLSSFDGFILFDIGKGILRHHNDNGNPIFGRNGPIKINNQLWAPSDHGIVSLNLKTGRVSNPIKGAQGLGGNYVNQLILDNNGYVWAGSRLAGLDRIDPVSGSIKHYEHIEGEINSLPENSVYVIHEKDDRHIWVGTNGGLALLDKDTETFESFKYDPADSTSISSNQISDICLTNTGIYWIATYGGGINRYVPETESFIRYTSQNKNIPNNTVYSCIEDDYGNIWISTAFAIGRFSPEVEKCDFVLKESDYYKVTKLPGGKLCYSGPKGVLVIDPENIKINSSAPKITLESIAINGELLFTSESDNTLELEHDQNDIEFKFFAAHFSNAVQNKYNVMLKGYDNDWRNLGTSNFINYTNLEPGNYTLNAKAASSFNIWSEPIEMNIHISRPWWQTWWAYSIYTMIAFGFLYYVRKFELNRQKKNAAIKESKLRAEAAELQAKAAEAQSRVIQAENERKTKELEEARKLQLSMLPKEIPQLSNLDIAVYMKTATEVGGDYYDFHLHPDGTLTVVLGDATGHGMQSGMMVSIMKSLFMSDRSNKELVPFFKSSNQAIKDMHLGRLMMALTSIQFNSHKIKVANAGMPSTLIYRQKNNDIEEIAINNLPLGGIKNFDYETMEAVIHPGDTVLMLSDGFPELSNQNDEQLGYKKVKEYFGEAAEKNPEEIVNYLKEKGFEWAEGKENDDDITFVVIKVK